MRTVLYCGMADDILSPLIHVPEARIFYAINLFDPAFCTGRTWESQQQDILTMLKLGHDGLSQHYIVYKDHGRNVTHLPLGPATDIETEDRDGAWVVTFTYGGEERTLVYYNGRNYYHPWPEEITGITDLLTDGAPFDYDTCPTLRQMLATRLAEPPATVRMYACAYPGYPFTEIVEGRHRDYSGVVHMTRDTIPATPPR